jgi:hypothetical protein
MGYSIEYVEEDDIVQVTVVGPFSFDSTLDMTSDVIRELSNNGSHRLLQDHRQASLEMSTLDIFKLPRVAKAFGLASNTKVALVYNQDQKDYKFIETTTVNQGYVLKVFADIREAKQWLIETPTGPTKLDR